MPAKTPRSSPWSGTGVQARAHALALAAGVATPLSRATSPILIGEDMPAKQPPAVPRR